MVTNFRTFFLILLLMGGVLWACSKKEKDSTQRFWTEGKRLLDAGNTLESLQYLERAHARDTDNEEGIVYLSKAYIQNNNPKQASNVLATFLAANPGQAATWYMLALSRYSERKFDAAVESLEEALNQQPRFPEAILLLGTIYEEYEEWSAAIHAYSQIADDLALGPPLVPVLLRLSRLLQRDMQETDEKRIEQYLLSAYRLTPGDPEVLKSLGSWYLERGKKPEAARYFEAWVKMDMNSGMAHHHRGLAAAAMGEHENAVASYRRAVQLEPDHVEIHLALAASLEKLNQRDQLYLALVAAAAADPTNTQVKWRLLPFYIEKGRMATAEALFAELADERGTDPEYYRMKTLFHENRGEYRLAYEAHMSRVSISGQVGDDFTRQAGFLARWAGMYEKAVEILSPLAMAYPEDVAITRELNLALWFSGKQNDGLAGLRKIGAGDTMSEIWLAYLLLQTPGQQSQAETVLQSLPSRLKSDEEKLFYYDVLVQQLRNRKDWKGIVAALEKALPLARHEEERNALANTLNAAKKEMNPTSVPEKTTPAKKTETPVAPQEDAHGHTH